MQRKQRLRLPNVERAKRIAHGGQASFGRMDMNVACCSGWVGAQHSAKLAYD